MKVVTGQENHNLRKHRSTFFPSQQNNVFSPKGLTTPLKRGITLLATTDLSDRPEAKSKVLYLKVEKRGITLLATTDLSDRPEAKSKVLYLKVEKRSVTISPIF